MIFGNKNGHTYYASLLLRRQCSQIIGTSSAQLTSTRLTGEVILIKYVMDLYELITMSFAFRTCCQSLLRPLYFNCNVWLVFATRQICDFYLVRTWKWSWQLTLLSWDSHPEEYFYIFHDDKIVSIGDSFSLVEDERKSVCVGQSMWKRCLVLVFSKCIYKLFSFADPHSVLHSDAGLGWGWEENTALKWGT